MPSRWDSATCGWRRRVFHYCQRRGTLWLEVVVIDDDNRADQMNPNNDAYWQSRGYDDRPDDWEGGGDDDDRNDDNRAKQLNPNNDAYWSSRSEERPA